MSPLFVLTPASLVWSPVFGSYHTYLSLSVSALRIKLQKAIGHGPEGINFPEGTAPKDAKPASEQEKTHDEKKLQVAVRAHANFSEFVPLAYLFITIGELNGAPTWLAHTAYALLFGFRVAHVELGLKKPYAAGLGRLIGALGTLGVTVGAGVYNFQLGLDAFRAFIGA